MMASQINRSDEVNGVLRTIEQHGVELTPDVVMQVVRIVFGYTDSAEFARSIMPAFPIFGEGYKNEQD